MGCHGNRKVVPVQQRKWLSCSHLTQGLLSRLGSDAQVTAALDVTDSGTRLALSVMAKLLEQASFNDACFLVHEVRLVLLRCQVQAYQSNVYH
jgi:hypothetical protein